MDVAKRTPGHDHDRWHVMFANAGCCVSESHWHEAAFLFAKCRDSLERDFSMEEKSLFLSYENAIGTSRGPTALMRAEHRRIRGVLALLSRALSTCDADGFIKQAATLDMMLRQHSEKKESIRYLMAQQAWVD